MFQKLKYYLNKIIPMCITVSTLLLIFIVPKTVDQKALITPETRPSFYDDPEYNFFHSPLPDSIYQGHDYYIGQSNWPKKSEYDDSEDEYLVGSDDESESRDDKLNEKLSNDKEYQKIQRDVDLGKCSDSVRIKYLKKHYNITWID